MNKKKKVISTMSNQYELNMCYTLIKIKFVHQAIYLFN